ncbi:hypothetical protein M3J09_005521 [Ascochyta lentis]
MAKQYYENIPVIKFAIFKWTCPLLSVSIANMLKEPGTTSPMLLRQRISVPLIYISRAAFFPKTTSSVSSCLPVSPKIAQSWCLTPITLLRPNCCPHITTTLRSISL